MKSIQLGSYLASVRARKAAFRFDESAAAVDARRNNGGRRLRGKRELLANAAKRAEAAGASTVISY